MNMNASELETVTIYGASDDCIELDGALKGEAYASDEGDHMAFSDGTVLHIEYTAAGCWRINRVVTGSATYSKVEAEGADTDNYSDRVTLVGKFEWCMVGALIYNRNER